MDTIMTEDEQRKQRRTEVADYFKQQAEKNGAYAAAARDDVLRIVTGANSGGAIACLAVVGALLTRSTSGTYPWFLLLVLACFLLGLTASLFAYLYRSNEASARALADGRRQLAYAVEEDSERQRLLATLPEIEERMHQAWKWRQRLTTVAGVTCLIGAAAGVQFLVSKAA